jgi:hypothetical protein
MMNATVMTIVTLSSLVSMAAANQSNASVMIAADLVRGASTTNACLRLNVEETLTVRLTMNARAVDVSLAVHHPHPNAAETAIVHVDKSVKMAVAFLVRTNAHAMTTVVRMKNV